MVLITTRVGGRVPSWFHTLQGEMLSVFLAGAWAIYLLVLAGAWAIYFLVQR